MKKHFSPTGVIIRKTDFGEADRIVTVLTKDDGKIDCLAKGARRIKSRFCGRLELLSHVELSCVRGRELAYLNEARLMSFHGAGTDTQKHRILFFIAELTGRLIPSDQHLEGAYALLLETLAIIEHNNRPEVVLNIYLTKLLTMAGFLSPWNQCAVCGQPLNPNEPILLSHADANAVCRPCSSVADHPLPLPLTKWVNFMQSRPFTENLRVNPSPADHAAVWQWLMGVLGNILSHPLKSEEFLMMG